jgi:CMP-N-acetylneuraminic acid synthetase
MRILAVVPARGGSKRIPKKNIKLLGGIPLINWTLNVTKNISDICDVLVSTDDIEIAKISTQAGAIVPWFRPAELSTDEANSADVAIHALDWYETNHGVVDGLLLLQPTSPFRTFNSVVKAINLYQEFCKSTVISVHRKLAPPYYHLVQGEKKLVLNSNLMGVITEVSDLEKIYSPNGSIYLISTNEIRKNLSFFSNLVIPVFSEKFIEDIDIDEEWDFRLAELLTKYLLK